MAETTWTTDRSNLVKPQNNRLKFVVGDSIKFTQIDATTSRLEFDPEYYTGRQWMK